MHYFVGGLMALLAMALSGVSATLSTQGYGHAFPEIFGAPAIGATIAAMALLTAFCLGIAQRQGSVKGVCVAALMIPITGLGDVAGNSFALSGAVAEKKAAYEASMAAYRQAETDLATARDRLTKAQDQLETVTGDDKIKAQKLLMGLGLYDGKLDGIIGPLTRKAIADLAVKLNATIETETANEATAQAVIAAGLPAKTAEGEGAKALGISIALTLIALLASYLSSLIMSGGKGLKEELDQIEAELTDFETEVVDLVDYIQKARAA